MRPSALQPSTTISVMMSMMYQESSFNADAKPPRTTFLWIFPGPRPTSAFGYAQALDMTWDGYLDKTGRWFADRNDFEDAIDFIGWYNSQSYKHSNVGLNDSYHLYLAYHEGHGGFNRRSFKGKSANPSADKHYWHSHTSLPAHQKLHIYF